MSITGIILLLLKSVCTGKVTYFRAVYCDEKATASSEARSKEGGVCGVRTVLASRKHRDISSASSLRSSRLATPHLSPAAEGVRHGAGRKGYERGRIRGRQRAMAALNHDDRHREGEDAVAEDGKSGAGEEAARDSRSWEERRRHQRLLAVTPRQVRHLQAYEAREEVRRHLHRLLIVIAGAVHGKLQRRVPCRL